MDNRRWTLLSLQGTCFYIWRGWGILWGNNVCNKYKHRWCMGAGELCRHSKWPPKGRHFKISLILKLYVFSAVWLINIQWFSILWFLLTINISFCVCILQNYGGFVMDMASVENRRLVKRLREKESLLTWEKQMPALWSTKAFSVNLSIH